jgi:hypothetical protein
MKRTPFRIRELIIRARAAIVSVILTIEWKSRLSSSDPIFAGEKQIKKQFFGPCNLLENSLRGWPGGSVDFCFPLAREMFFGNYFASAMRTAHGAQLVKQSPNRLEPNNMPRSN